MSGRIEAACGSWASQVGTGLTAGKATMLSMLRADGASLLWLESRPAEAGRVVLCRQEGAAVQQLTTPPFDVGSRVHEYGGGAYASSGGRIGFSHRPDGSVWLIDPGSAPRAICTVPGLRFADLCFTPDGRWLVAVREDHRDPRAAQPEAAIVALRLDAAADPSTAEGKVLVCGADFLASPHVSPDGGSLAWIEWDHPAMPWNTTRLHRATMLQDAQGQIELSEMRCLAGDRRDEAPGEALMQPGFSEGGALHVCSDRTGWWNLYRVGTDGALTPLCPMQREIGLPPWVFGQRSYRFMPDGGVIAAAVEQGRVLPLLIRDGIARLLPIGPVAECPVLLSRADGPQLGWLRASADQAAAVMTAPLRQDLTGAPAMVAASHTLSLRAEDIAVAEPMRCRGSDGGDVHAFYYAPANRRYAVPAGERPPLVVMAHGGPTGMASEAFSLRVQWWTSRGIGVVDVNYRGSTGFGRAYRERLDGQWGVVDVDDCLAACTHLIDSGRADPARIAIRGSSAGGFTVLAALTRSTLFSAAACLYGIGELRDLAAETHKFERHYLDRLLGTLPEHGATYDARSPIRHLDALRCPVIFFHGTEDRVVPIGQTRAMAQALRQRGIQVAVHEFEGEAHGFRREHTIRQVLELELAFYGSLWGFTPSGARA